MFNWKKIRMRANLSRSVHFVILCCCALLNICVANEYSDRHWSKSALRISHKAVTSGSIPGIVVAGYSLPNYQHETLGCIIAVCVCMRACVRVCVRAFMRACVCVCVCARARVQFSLSVCTLDVYICKCVQMALHAYADLYHILIYICLNMHAHKKPTSESFFALPKRRASLCCFLNGGKTNQNITKNQIKEAALFATVECFVAPNQSYMWGESEEMRF